MYKNIDAEQARNGHTNTDVANYLGISRQAFENKKKTGKFNANECKKLCILYRKSFEYLFESEEERLGA